MRIGVFSLILFMMFACTSRQRVITVEAKGLNTGKLYLCEVISEYRGIHQAVDSAVLKDDKSFLACRGRLLRSYILSGIPRGMVDIFFWMVMI